MSFIFVILDRIYMTGLKKTLIFSAMFFKDDIHETMPHWLFIANGYPPLVILITSK